MLLVFIDESGKPTIKEASPYEEAALIIRDADFLDLSSARDHIVKEIRDHC